jgi:hypothetical protein
MSLEDMEAELGPLVDKVWHYCFRGIYSCNLPSAKSLKSGAPDKIRTCDLCLRRAAGLMRPRRTEQAGQWSASEVRAPNVDDRHRARTWSPDLA